MKNTIITVLIISLITAIFPPNAFMKRQATYLTEEICPLYVDFQKEKIKFVRDNTNSLPNTNYVYTQYLRTIPFWNYNIFSHYSIYKRQNQELRIHFDKKTRPKFFVIIHSKSKTNAYTCIYNKNNKLVGKGFYSDITDNRLIDRYSAEINYNTFSKNRFFPSIRNWKITKLSAGWLLFNISIPAYTIHYSVKLLFLNKEPT